ncbi:MAG: GIN domain-containing protein [Bacteroidia bacterium]
MKTSIKTLLTTGLLALAVSTSTVYANGSSPQIVSATSVDIASIQKIIVTGNVYVTIVQAPKSKFLYQNENNAEVIVKKTSNSLTIDGTNSVNTAEVTVYVDEIYRIDASGSAMVQTKGAFSVKNLQVFVKDHAKVEVNAKTESLYTVIKDSAELKLQGHSDSHVLTMDKLSKITLENFSATKTEKNNSDATALAAVRY